MAVSSMKSAMCIAEPGARGAPEAEGEVGKREEALPLAADGLGGPALSVPRGRHLPARAYIEHYCEGTPNLHLVQERA